MQDEVTGGVPGVDVALDVGGDDLFAAVTEEVAGGGRLEHRVVVGGGQLPAGEGALTAMQRQRVGVHRPARQVFDFAGRGRVAIGVDPAVGVGDDQLV